MKKLSGSCGCGSIAYEINSDIKNVVNCHCNMCKNHNGTPLSTYAVVLSEALNLVKGKGEVCEYGLGSGIKRFCKKCGTPIFNTNDKYPGVSMVFLGTLRSPEKIEPAVNIWCENKFDWIDSISNAASLEQGIENKNA